MLLLLQRCVGLDRSTLSARSSRMAETDMMTSPSAEIMTVGERLSNKVAINRNLRGGIKLDA